MATCQSWRLSSSPHEPLHFPGECAECWTECTSEADGDFPRCRSCYEALASSPVGWVRRLLINEEKVPEYVVMALLDDGNFSVAGTAQWHMDHSLAGSPTPDRPAPTQTPGSDESDDSRGGAW